MFKDNEHYFVDSFVKKKLLNTLPNFAQNMHHDVCLLIIGTNMNPQISFNVQVPMLAPFAKHDT